MNNKELEQFTLFDKKRIRINFVDICNKFDLSIEKIYPKPKENYQNIYNLRAAYSIISIFKNIDKYNNYVYPKSLTHIIESNKYTYDWIRMKIYNYPLCGQSFIEFIYHNDLSKILELELYIKALITKLKE